MGRKFGGLSISTDSIYPPRINLLQWAPVQGFLGDEDAEAEFNTMYHRTIGKYEADLHGNNSQETERAARQMKINE